MKEKDFEVIVPAYDALEAELEDILGGAGCTKCKDHIGCNGYSSGGKDCANVGEYSTPDIKCCPGLIGVPVGNGTTICVKPA